jgi:hypothetical protein
MVPQLVRPSCKLNRFLSAAVAADPAQPIDQGGPGQPRSVEAGY